MSIPNICQEMDSELHLEAMSMSSFEEAWQLKIPFLIVFAIVLVSELIYIIANRKHPVVFYRTWHLYICIIIFIFLNGVTSLILSIENLVTYSMYPTFHMIENITHGLGYLACLCVGFRYLMLLELQTTLTESLNRNNLSNSQPNWIWWRLKIIRFLSTELFTWLAFLVLAAFMITLFSVLSLSASYDLIILGYPNTYNIIDSALIALAIVFSASKKKAFVYGYNQTCTKL